MTVSSPQPFALERWFAAHAGTGAIDLSSSGAAPRSLRDLLQLATPHERAGFEAISLGYGSPDGAPTLREAVAGRSLGADADAVTITCGAIEALRLTVDALVGEGDEVVVQEPMYGAVAGLARARGAVVRTWQLAPERGFVGSLDELESLIGPRTVLVAITQPNSPTGSIIEGRDLDELIGLLAGRGIWLLSDEVYRELALDPALVVASAWGRYDRAVVVGDVAKPFGLGGLRIGWLVAADPDFRTSIATGRDYTTLSPPTPSMVLAEIALRHADELLAGPLGNARANLDQLASACDRAALALCAPQAGVTAFPALADAAEVQRRLAASDVLVVPGSLFGRDDRIRIGLAGPPVEFGIGLARLEQFCTPA